MSTTQPEFTMSQYASKDDMIGAMRQHIAELESRVQELGQMARDVNSRRVVEMEAQLASIGAGGVSLMGAASAGSEAVAWPTTPADVRAFVGSHFSSLFYGDPDAGELKPHENDSYEMTAHDLISAFRWWAECHPSPPEGMVGGWMPIETAPKDGTEVLLRSARGHIADGFANPNCWVWPYIKQEPTYWQPLPPAPKE